MNALEIGKNLKIVEIFVPAKLVCPIGELGFSLRHYRTADRNTVLHKIMRMA
ncbi:MAG: hypothetical protein ABIO73_00365 [Polaromonas sp.]